MIKIKGRVLKPASRGQNRPLAGDVEIKRIKKGAVAKFSNRAVSTLGLTSDCFVSAIETKDGLLMAKSTLPEDFRVKLYKNQKYHQMTSRSFEGFEGDYLLTYYQTDENRQYYLLVKI